MKRAAWVRRVAPLVAGSLVAAGCGGGVSYYRPEVVARGEMTLRYQGRFEMWAGGRKVTEGLTYEGLAEYVRCVPPALEHAEKATTDGKAAVALSILGGSLGGVALGGFAGAAADRADNHTILWLGGGVGVALVGLLFAGLGRLNRNAANGHAVDAMNYYNDSAGSLGATCDDLRYPPPVGPLPVPPPPPPPIYVPPPVNVPPPPPESD